MVATAAPATDRAHAASLAALAPVGLDELLAGAELQDRLDRKYVVTDAQLAAVLEALSGTHRALELDGVRDLRYRTTYYDTLDRLTYRMHVQGRRRRFKCRKRRYLDTGLSRFEVKLKGPRDRTVKHATPSPPDDALAPGDLAFLRERLLDAYGLPLQEPLAPALTVSTTRLTIAAPQLGERLTCDVELALGRGRLADGHAILESKSAGGWGAADAVLRDLGVRPVQRCSKYLIGTALTVPDVRANLVRPLLSRYFLSST